MTGPMKPMTKSLAGCSYRSRGVPTCSMRPSLMTDDLLGDVHRLLLVVGHEDGGDVDLVVQPAQPGAQLLAHLGVEGAEGLVEQQHARLDRQRAGQRHALALPARELRRVAVGQALEVHEREQLVDPRADSSLARLRTFSPKATLSRTVMCLKAA